MQTVKRLLSNTFLAFTSNIIVRASNSLLFIFIGRSLGPTAGGVFNLGITYFTVIFALSAWGLHELLVRELAPRRDESSRYIANYLAIRLTLATAIYTFLLLALGFVLPYSATTETVIRILGLAVFPEAIFSIVQALFQAHERLLPPALVAATGSVVKLGGGLWLLYNGYDVRQIAWMVPIGSGLSLLLFLPFLWQLFRSTGQRLPGRLSWSFTWSQLRHTPSFVVIHLFSLLDYQADAFLISLLLSETDVGWYGAAQTVMLAFWMMPTALRTAIYPLMARYRYEAHDKLVLLYQKASQYLIVFILPAAAGVFLLAPGIIRLIFDASFDPAVPALRWSIWAVVFGFLNVPNARLMLVYDRQRAAAWLTGLSMVINVILNLLLIPVYGIAGAAMARTFASLAFFLLIYAYVQRNILRSNVLPALIRPGLATLAMVAVVWQVRGVGLLWPVLAGVAVYALAGFLLRIVPAEDWTYWRQLLRSGLAEKEDGQPLPLGNGEGVT